MKKKSSKNGLKIVISISENIFKNKLSHTVKELNYILLIQMETLVATPSNLEHQISCVFATAEAKVDAQLYKQYNGPPP